MRKSDCKLVKRTVAGRQAYFFRYKVNSEITCEFSMLCEVGRPWIPIFEDMIKDAGLDLVTVEIDERPWIITVDR